MSQEAMQQLKGPALGLKIVAGVGVAWTIVMLALNLAGVGFASLDRGNVDDSFAMMFGGGVMVAISALVVGIYVLVWVGAAKMTALSSYGLCITAAILVMLPCSLCCVPGIPVGIWALVVLLKPEVKEAFQRPV